MSETPRTLRDYARHDDDCASRRCVQCNRPWDQHVAEALSTFPCRWTAGQPCSCGLDALLSAPDAPHEVERLRASLKEIHRECLDEGHTDSGVMGDACNQRGQVIRCGICVALETVKKALAAAPDAVRETPQEPQQ